MSSLFRTIFSWNPFAASSKEPKKLLLLGLDASGKTTFLYQIKNYADEVETTIPTIGFNVETLQLGGMDFKCWDIGGCDKLRVLWRHYMVDLSAAIFMVDSNDFERMDSVKEEMNIILQELDKKVPLLIINNKIDLPNSRSIEETFRALGLHEMKDRQWEILPCCAINKSQCKDCLSWIQNILSGTTKLFKPKHGLSSEAYFKSEKERREKLLLESKRTNSELISFQDPVLLEVEKHNHRKFTAAWKEWIKRAEVISLEEEFDDENTCLAQFQDANLPSWDHYTHVRLAYILIKRKGTDEGFRAVEEGIRNYIQANQVQTNGKSFHPTMTRFWCHMVAFWLFKYLNTKADVPDTTTKMKNSEFWNYLMFVHEQKDDSTDLAQAGLFRQYYSAEVMFGPIAKSTFSDPDIQPLPLLNVK